MERESVYDRVKRCCDEAGITIKELEVETGLSNGTVGHWRSGTPTLVSIAKVAKYFHKSIDYFVGA